MKILVTAKRVIDSTVRVRVRPDGSGVDTANAKMAMNPFDETAVEQAVRFREAGAASEVLAVTLGDAGSEEVLRTALAFGADRALRVESDNPLEPLAVSRALAGLVEREQPDLVLMGKQAIDDDSNQVGQMLAQHLGWGQATFACAIHPEGEELQVTREVDGGRRTVAVRLPAVVTTELDLNQPRYIKLPNIMKAKKKPIDRISLDDLGVDGASRLELLGVEEPPPRAAGERVASVAELVDRLKNDAQVI
ncbi:MULTISPECIES: electron transfer flavoprotein subunit beta/FixA family protein [unclassified Halorhodospira]|uniref:electron transfer flavoprotein subunit beta/FixA family protein n=1 Tax=unclassified Halorhodospira TaxID=2626748 RepID=UPI001EE7C90C|nr:MULTISPECIES: electron transfer flavoprotein subunit beta/FixA family protein [unclassified Halorhodospira]MCG5540205.1 electron transfer flavoprotein subunit beta/FixA family protein [Halorhodospira sp. M39old]MCG5545094.1 electron transfer flavoprotein subunit beta/FixA family protein [Halorhodospira sp. M38]